MKHTYPNLIIERPAPGHYVIYGHKPQPVDTDEGRVVPLDQCYITDGIPSELLMDILLERGYLTGGVGFSPVADGCEGADGACCGPIGEVGPIGSIGEVGPIGSIGIPGPSLKDAILSKLEESGNIRIKALAESVGCTVEDIKALDGHGLTVGNAGWVSLSDSKEGAE